MLRIIILLKNEIMFRIDLVYGPVPLDNLLKRMYAVLLECYPPIVNQKRVIQQQNNTRLYTISGKELSGRMRVNLHYLALMA